MTRRTDVVGMLLLVAATAVGLWLGLGGPDVSPVLSELPFPPGFGGGGGGAR
jgi:hypothetical protein